MSKRERTKLSDIIEKVRDCWFNSVQVTGEVYMAGATVSDTANVDDDIRSADGSVAH